VRCVSGDAARPTVLLREAGAVSVEKKAPL